MSDYRDEDWYELLQVSLRGKLRKDVAEMLGLSAPTLSQVLNRSGKYGRGEASTTRVAERVIHVFGRYECAYLSEQAGESRIVTGDDCRTYAHRPPPVGSPRDMQHWQACNRCPHKAATAPATSKTQGGKS
jgi:hypothetical protein